jgi:hypothetical protein
MNPLDTGEEFAVEFMNPNPSSSKTKAGPVYRVSFEVHRELWDEFMDAETAGMVLEGSLAVTAKNEPLEAPEAPRPKGGVLARNAGMLCQDELANQWAATLGFHDLKDLIYRRCVIDSRAELDHDREAAKEFERIKSDFARAML